MEIKDYWFSLKSHVYVYFKKEKILLYNTQSGSKIETSLKEAITLVNQLYEPVNLGVIVLESQLLSNLEVQNFVKEVQKKEMGDLWEIRTGSQKPIRFIPILNLQNDIDKLHKKRHEFIESG